MSTDINGECLQCFTTLVDNYDTSVDCTSTCAGQPLYPVCECGTSEYYDPNAN